MKNSSTTRIAAGIRLALVTGLLAVLGALPATAQVEGISYTLSPEASRIIWDDDAALSNGWMYGGEFGLGFGSFVELRGVYLTGSNFETDFSDFSLTGDAAGDEVLLDALANLEARDVDVRRYGARLRVNLAAGAFVPFVSAGTGVIDFDPEGLENTENVYGSVGVGLTWSPDDRYTVSVAAQNLAYRYNPLALLSEENLTEIGVGPGIFEQQTVYNPALSAALTFYVGGRDPGELSEVDQALLSQFRPGGFSLAIEPFYGQINFSDDLNFPESQALAGVNAGFDLGPYVGVRGFYWRATEQADALDDGLSTDFTDLALYGGELNLRFASAPSGGIIPYLIIGGGYVNVGDEYGDFAGVQPESRYFASGGGGVEVPLSSALRLQGGIRALLMSNQDIEDVSQVSNVFGSFMYTAGISFNLGGDRYDEDVLGELQEEQRERVSDVEAELDEIRTRLMQLEAEEQAEQQQAEQQEAEQQQMAQEPDQQETAQQRDQQVDRRIRAEADRQVATDVRGDTVFVRDVGQEQLIRRSNISGKTITVPVPEQGAIYLRFGEPAPMMPEPAPTPAPARVVLDMAQQPGPIMVRDTAMAGGALTASEVREIVQDVLAEELEQIQVQEEQVPAQEQETRRQLPRPIPGDEVVREDAVTEEELSERLDELEERLVDRIALAMREADGNGRQQVVIREDEEQRTQERPVIVREEDGQAVVREEEGYSLMRVFERRRLDAVLPMTGFRTGEGATKFLIGARANYSFPNSSVLFAPTALLGFGDGTSLNLVANGILPLAGQYEGALQPYVGTGLGLISEGGFFDLDLALNLLAGVEYTTTQGATFFGEYSTMDFFDFHRFLFGYRVSL